MCGTTDISKRLRSDMSHNSSQSKCPPGRRRQHLFSINPPKEDTEAVKWSGSAVYCTLDSKRLSERLLLPFNDSSHTVEGRSAAMRAPRLCVCPRLKGIISGENTDVNIFFWLILKTCQQLSSWCPPASKRWRSSHKWINWMNHEQILMNMSHCYLTRIL